MLSLSYGREIVVAEDKTSNESTTKETDTQGGGRITESSNIEGKTIIVTGKDGVSAPLVLREVQPKIEGVIIIAEGGDNVFVKQALTSAAEAVLGLDIAKVQIYKMKS
jgi:stage III sporulation protein AG